MDIEKETWNVINSYFRDTKDFMITHHIDSYNDFIKVKIPQLFSKDNPLSFHKNTFFRTDMNNDNIYYETTAYFGGKSGEGIYLSKPTIVDLETSNMKQLYPNEARLKNLTYGSDLYYDLDIEFSMKEKRDGKEDKIIYENVPIPSNNFLKHNLLGKIPVMLRSCLCVLDGTSPELRSIMGESKYDVGGYFIIDGAEKVIVSEERRVENKIFLLPSSDDKYYSRAEIKSSSLEEFQPARTTKLQLEKPSGRITLRLGQDVPFIDPTEDGRDIPLFIMFRLLGIETDKDILECICNDLDNDLSKKMVELLGPSINDPIIIERQIYDQQTAIHYLEQRTRKARLDADINQVLKMADKRISHLYDTIYETFVPHVGRDFHIKACYMGYMTNQYLKYIIGLEEETNRDNFINKRIDLSGFILSNSFRNAVREFIRRVDINISTKYELAHTEYSNENYVNIINEKNFGEIFDISKFQSHFLDTMKRGNIDLSLGKKMGIIQSLERRSYFNDLAHLRKIRDPVTGKVTDDRRRLHSSQYGCVCPVETPEGQNVGLQKNLAIMSRVSFGCSPKEIIKLVKELDLIELHDISFNEMYNKTKVFVNGVWIGVHLNPQILYKLLLLYRRNGLINIFTSIAWYSEKNEIIICSDQGRFCRPLYIVENNQLLLQPEILNKLKEKEYTWDDLTIGFNKRNYNYNIYDCKTGSPSDLGIYMDKNETIEDLIFKLNQNKSIIEYLDAEELNTTVLLSPTINIPNDNKNYTHCELHPSMALGITSFLLPFIQHNPAARNSFALAHTKQGIGYNGTNLSNRIDTTAHFLYYGQRPLCISRLNKAINNDKMISGMNVVIAISVLNGFNQEDAIVFNKSSLDRGLFQTGLYKRYAEHEVVDQKTGMIEKFYNPLNNKNNLANDIPNTIIKNNNNYSKLDEYGFIKEGSVLEEGDVVIGKYMRMKDEKGNIIYRDISVAVKRDHIGSVVDKVFTAMTNINKDKMVKIRICQHRVPEIGDKFASRCGQKGTMGMFLASEDMPYTKDGLVPDMILNPYAYNKRMTVAQFIELLFGRLAIEMGFFGLASPFEPINVEEIGKILEGIGLDRYSNETLYDGMSGRMMDTTIYTGPMYYQRLKHMVHDKINARTSGERINGIVVPGGKYDVKTRQPTGGRALGGGLRIGEMERDAILAHGISGFMRESMMERADKFVIYVSKKTGHICFVNPNNEFNNNLYYNPGADGPIVYQMAENIQDNTLLSKSEILGLNMEKQTDYDFCKIEIPYTTNLLLHELTGLGCSVRINIKNMQVEVGDKKIMDLDASYNLKGGGDSDDEYDDEDDDDNDDESESESENVSTNIDVNGVTINEELEPDMEKLAREQEMVEENIDKLDDVYEKKENYELNLNENLEENEKRKENSEEQESQIGGNDNENDIIGADEILTPQNKTSGELEMIDLDNGENGLNMVDLDNEQQIQNKSNITEKNNITPQNQTIKQSGGNDVKIVRISDTSISTDMPDSFNNFDKQLIADQYGGKQIKTNQNNVVHMNSAPDNFQDNFEIDDIDELRDELDLENINL